MLNASPDLRQQMEACPSLRGQGGSARGSGLQGVLLCSADLDQSLGLFLLREGDTLPVFCSPGIRETLSKHLCMSQMLRAYCGLQWKTAAREPEELHLSDGSSSGLVYWAKELAGHLPCYAGGGPGSGSTLLYHLVEPASGGHVIFAPHLAELKKPILKSLADCDLLLLDGTFWSEDEMPATKIGSLRASEMGHLPVGLGSHPLIAALPKPRKVYVHINNINPMLVRGSAEQQAVEAAGCQVGWDGMEFTL